MLNRVSANNYTILKDELDFRIYFFYFISLKHNKSHWGYGWPKMSILKYKFFLSAFNGYHELSNIPHRIASVTILLSKCRIVPQTTVEITPSIALCVWLMNNLPYCHNHVLIYLL